MKQTKRKGFTIVELVIVIAVIAILAAVLIPTFASLINKANRSADIQAVHQMNTQLAIDEVDSNKTITDVYEALKDAGMSAEDYHPLANDTYFFWDKDLNRILYTDNTYTVVYPEEHEGETYDENKTWYSLSGVIKEVPVDIDADGNADVTSAGELYYLSENVPSTLKKITLKNDIDLMGADVSFSVVGTEFAMEGQQSGTIITGLVTNEYKTTMQSGESAGKTYSSGLIAKVSDAGASADTELTLKNITIKDSVVGDLETGSIGALVGDIRSSDKTQNSKYYKTTVTIENCTVENTIVNGKNKIGALIGGVGIRDNSSLTIKGCTVNNCTVNCSEGQSAKVIGCIWSGTVTLEDGGYTESGNTVNLVKGDREIIENAELSYTNNGTSTKTTTIVREWKDGKPDGNAKYRMFDKDAVINLQLGKIVNGSSTIEHSNITSATYNNREIAINILEIIKSDNQ